MEKGDKEEVEWIEKEEKKENWKNKVRGGGDGKKKRIERKEDKWKEKW